MNGELDSIDWKLLRALQNHARVPFAELGRQVGLSPPAVAERVRRLEDAGIIRAYRAEVAPSALGWSIMAFVRLQTSPDRYEDVRAIAQQRRDVLECHHVAGGDAFVLRIVAQSVAQLETLIERLSNYGQTTTSIVLSSPIMKQAEKP